MLCLLKTGKTRKLFFAALLLCFVLSVFALKSYAQETPSHAVSVSSAPVAPFGETLFTITGDAGAVTAAKRAQIIENNIISLRNAMVFDPELLTIAETKQSSNIEYLEKTISGVTDEQAKIAGKTRAELAKDYSAIIAQAVTNERSKNEYVILIKQVGLIIAIVLFAFFCIKGINLLHDYIKKYLTSKRDSKSETLLELDKQINIFFSILNMIKITLVLFLIYICFLIFLWFFPGTHSVAYTLIDYIKVPLVTALLAVWHYIPDLIEIIVILFLFQILSKILSVVSDRIAEGKIKFKSFHKVWAKPTYQIARIILIIFAFIFIFPHLPNSNSSVFKGISVFLGVLLSLGSTSIISNIVSGFVITYMQPFVIGDRIKMGEHCGDVIEKNALVTRIKTSKNEIITIPNSTIMTATTTNYTNSAKTYGLILHADVTVGYDTDWRKVQELLIEAALKTPDILPEPKPFVQPKALDDFYIKYQINVYTNDAAKMNNTYSNLYKNIVDIFAQEKIELLSPHYTVMRDESKPAVPAK